MRLPILLPHALGLALAIPAAFPAMASDHGDTPVLIAAARHDARITDLFAFVRDERLVLGVCLDPTIPPGATTYAFSPDLRVQINVDYGAHVRFDDPDDLARYGGTIVRPQAVREDVVYRITFPDGVPRLDVRGLRPHAENEIRFFAGLRDDPFIRGPREGRNVVGLVVELPLDVARPEGKDVLLVWATSKVPALGGPFQDLAGRALRSQFPEHDAMNGMLPRRHDHVLDVPPDVMIFDVSRPAHFPNGRELGDDVVDLVGDARVLANDAPYPSVNDVEFLDAFPYLAPPHP
jgi:hypothetical protein